MLLVLDSRSLEYSCILLSGSRIHLTSSQEWISFWALLILTESRLCSLCLMIVGTLRASLAHSQLPSQVYTTQDGFNRQELTSIQTRPCSQCTRSTSSTLLVSSRMTLELLCGTFTMNQATLIIFLHQCLSYKVLSNGQDKQILLNQFPLEYGTGGSTMSSLTTTNWKTLTLLLSMLTQMRLILTVRFRISKYMGDLWL